MSYICFRCNLHSVLSPIALLPAGLLPEQNNVEELYAKVQKPRDRKKHNKEVTREGKELMMNGSSHVEDSSPPPLPVSGISSHMQTCRLHMTCVAYTVHIDLHCI